MITDGFRFRIGLSVVLGLIWTSAAVGDGPMFPGVQYEAGSAPSEVAIGDLNGDQIPDLAVADGAGFAGSDGGVSVLLGLGDGAFAPPVYYVAGDWPASITIGDLNGDQIPDLAVADYGRNPEYDGTIAVLLGLGDGTFEPAVSYAAGNGLRCIVIVDLNGDEAPDLVVADFHNHNVLVLLGLGDGTFAGAVSFAAGDLPYSVAIGDLDGDNVPDLVAVNRGSYPAYDGSASVLLGVGDGTFATAMSFPAGIRPLSVAIGDLDGDQVPDLAVASGATLSYYGSVSVLLGIGDGTFTPPVRYDVGGSPFSVAIGDLNGDEVPDLAVANTGSGNVSVLLGIGNGTFAAPMHCAGGAAPYFVAIGDLDGDQAPDLAVANGLSGNVTVLLGVGDGTFVAAVNYAASLNPRSVTIGDLDGDRVPDLAVANYGDHQVSVLMGIGDGTFAAKVDYDVGYGPFSVAIGDLDGDLVPDLAVANHGTYTGYEGTVSVLLGIGDGTFAAKVDYAVGDEPVSVSIGDLNGDLVPDLAVANAGSHPEYDDGSVSVLLGVGDGTFAASVSYVAGDRPMSAVIGDLDGDQVLDLAVANYGVYPSYDYGVSVLLGVGDGTFATAECSDAGYRPLFVAVGDLNGDQVPDLAVANDASQYISVLLGLGDGTFAASAYHVACRLPSSIAINDLDGDQVPDLAVTGLGSNNVSVLLGAGDGRFAAAAHYAAGAYPFSVAIGDLDGDNLPDLAVANFFAGNVTVLLNLRPTPGDIDGDDDVDMDDFALFTGCMGGPGVTTGPPGCARRDFDRADMEGDDGDVDLSDFILFARQFRGSQ